MRNLSKSKLLAFKQCPKRLWLEIHKPELKEDSPDTVARFDSGNRVGDVARKLYDPKGVGVLIDAQQEGFPAALERSSTLLNSPQPIFEAGFAAKGALAFADMMLPVKKKVGLAWRMVEVKSSAKVKDYQRDDVAIQAFVARAAGVPLESVSVATVDSSWVYRGDGRYNGLLKESDLTEEAFGREREIKEMLTEAHAVAGQGREPKRKTGKHCSDPFGCGFSGYCQSKEPRIEFPVEVLPRPKPALQTYIEERKIVELRNVPDKLLNEIQLRIKTHTLRAKTFFDSKGAAAALAKFKLPALFLDFESIHFAVPIWKGTRPYQHIPFQFSLHRLSRTGSVSHKSFLDLSGNDPSQHLAEALVETCGAREPIFVYHAAFEGGCIGGLAERFPRLRKSLLAINERLVDLLPIARSYFYHPNQEGSWSLKAVLPAAVPGLDYSSMAGVQDGGMAMSAYLEAIHRDTSPDRRQEIQRQLLEYCKMDTYALVRIWQKFAGRSGLKL